MIKIFGDPNGPHVRIEGEDPDVGFKCRCGKALKLFEDESKFRCPDDNCDIKGEVVINGKSMSIKGAKIER